MRVASRDRYRVVDATHRLRFSGDSRVVAVVPELSELVRSPASDGSRDLERTRVLGTGHD
jgi:hypothetical protein